MGREALCPTTCMSPTAKGSGRAVPAGTSGGLDPASSARLMGTRRLPRVGKQPPAAAPRGVIRRLTALGFCTLPGIAAGDCVRGAAVQAGARRHARPAAATGVGTRCRLNSRNHLLLLPREQPQSYSRCVGSAAPHQLHFPKPAPRLDCAPTAQHGIARRGVAHALTFMVGGAVRGGDSGRSGTVTSVLFSSSCFLKNQRQARQLPPCTEQEREVGDKGLSLSKPRACRPPVK